jgi:hypothetical protein
LSLTLTSDREFAFRIECTVVVGEGEVERKKRGCREGEAETHTRKNLSQSLHELLVKTNEPHRAEKDGLTINGKPP